MSVKRIRSLFVHYYAEMGLSVPFAAYAVSAATGHKVPAGDVVLVSTDLIRIGR